MGPVPTMAILRDIGPDARLDEEALRCLDLGIAAIEAHSDAPLRLRAHGRGRMRHTFELVEEFETGVAGRSFVVRVDRSGRRATLTFSTEQDCAA